MTGQDVLGRAIAAHQAGDLDTAARLYEAVLRANPARPDVLHYLGLVYHQTGRHESALKLLRQAARHGEATADLFLAIGEAFRALGRLEDAARAYRQAIRLCPEMAAAHGNLGLVLQEQGNVQQALECYQRVLRLEPDSVDALVHMGTALQEIGRTAEAIECYEKAIAADACRADALYNLGGLLWSQRRVSEAALCFHEAARYAPAQAERVLRDWEAMRGDGDRARSFCMMGSALQAIGRHAEAVEVFRHAIALQDEVAEAHDGLGVSLLHLGKAEEARGEIVRALDLEPGYAQAWNDLGTLHVAANAPGEAKAAFARAIELRPDYPEAWHNLGQLHVREQQFGEAFACFERALALRPDYALAHCNYAYALLMRGRWAEGWREYEWRLASRAGIGAKLGGEPSARPPHRGQRLLRPSEVLPIDPQGKRILFMQDQGISDELFFLRFAKVLHERGAAIAYSASPKIRSLLSRVDFLQLIDPASPSAQEKFDYVFSVGDAARVAGVETADAPPLVLTPEPERVAEIMEELAARGRGPFLGVTWRAGTGGPVFGNPSLYKEIPLQLLARAVGGWHGTIVCLQRDPQSGEIENFSRHVPCPVIDMTHLNEDLEAMLALLAVLDEYVGVSNANMHLRAGLGRPATVLVPHPPEWRWMATDDVSPWFPGFRVLRQSAAGEWDKALGELSQLIERRKKAP